MREEYFFPDRDRLFAALRRDCRFHLETALRADGHASFLVSGGSTPKPLYEQLSHEAINWSKVSVALVDERWVSPEHPASNEAFIRENLLKNNAATASFRVMKTEQHSAAEGHPYCEASYREIDRPFDLTLLGMGSDGHTASLFPGCSGLSEALDASNSQLCAAIEANPSEVTGEFTERMTLTLNGLMQSKQLHLLITGQEKLAVYQHAIVNRDMNLMPISAVLNQQQVPVNVYWAP